MSYSYLIESFKIPINCENKEFVTHPYIPVHYGKQRSNDKMISSNYMTVGRCFDIKYGASCGK
jgi:hypothetical protein